MSLPDQPIRPTRSVPPSGFDPDRTQSDFEFDFYGEILRRGGADAGVIRQQAEILVLRGDREAALDLQQRLLERSPDDALLHYRAACSLSTLGRVAEAVSELERAIALGYTDFDVMEQDADLDNLRGHEGFQRLIETQKA